MLMRRDAPVTVRFDAACRRSCLDAILSDRVADADAMPCLSLLA
jgi:hypothetical protein